MAAWIVLAFILGLACGVAGSSYLTRRLPNAAHRPAARRTDPATGEVAPDDSMSLTAQRLLSDLERKYEGVTTAGEPDVPRRKGAPRPTRRRPPKT